MSIYNVKITHLHCVISQGAVHKILDAWGGGWCLSKRYMTLQGGSRRYNVGWGGVFVEVSHNVTRGEGYNAVGIFVEASHNVRLTGGWGIINTVT